MSYPEISTGRRGFSLVELLVVIAISLIIGGAVMLALLSQTQLTATQNRNIINRENLRDSLRFMADEIQLIGTNASEPFVLTALAGEFDFVGDINGDGAIDRVLYTIDGTDVTRSLYSTANGGLSWSLESTDVVVDDVQGLTFTYFATGNAAPVVEADITSVDIEILLEQSRSATSFTAGKVAAQAMATRVTLRNRL